jgi:hypothetical protein
MRIWYLLALSGCATAIGDGDDVASEPVTADGSQVLRLITAEATTINPDATASEAGRTYSVVKDGMPDPPWISSAHLAGAHALAFHVPTDASGHKQRIEYKIAHASDADGLHFDNARYSGFAFKLGSDPAPFLGSALIWQAWQGAPWGPPASLKIVASSAPPYRLKLAIRNASTGTDSTVPDIGLWSSAIVEPNTWYRVLIYLRPRPDGSGQIKLWIDGTKVLDWTGAIGYDPAGPDAVYDGLDLKNGIYQPSANNGHTLYFDQIVLATTFAAATAAIE